MAGFETFNEEYRYSLSRAYPVSIVDQIADTENWHHAPIPGCDGESVPYVRVVPPQPREGAAPMLYVPGFGEGIINKASTAAELATRGYEVVLPGQNRRSLSRAETDSRSPTDFQADNYLAVLDHADLRDRAPTILARSYGALVFDAMSQIALEKGEEPFINSNVFLLAPAGMNRRENFGRLARGWISMLRSETKKEQQDFPDVGGVTGKASMAVLLANKRRTMREVGSLIRETIEPELPKRVGRLVIFSYAEDKLYPGEHHEDHAYALMEHGAVWATPISLDTFDDGKRYGHTKAMAIRGGRGAVHDDEQFNPSRVAGAVEQFLNSR